MGRHAPNRSGRGWKLVTLMFVLLGVGTLGPVGCDRKEAGGIEVFPRHFDLRSGKTIRYTPLEHGTADEFQFLEDYDFKTGDPQVLELRDRRGLFRAVSPGKDADHCQMPSGATKV